MVDKQIWISEELHTKIKVLSAKEQTLMRETINRAIKDYEVKIIKQDD